jgi:hypothetical protein
LTFIPTELQVEIEHLDLVFINNIIELAIESMLEQDIHKGQLEDEKLKEIAENVVLEKASGFRLDENGALWFGKIICVPEVKAICDTIL